LIYSETWFLYKNFTTLLFFTYAGFMPAGYNTQWNRPQEITMTAYISQDKERKENVEQAASSLRFGPGMLLPQARRLVVIIPNQNVNTVDFARTVRSLALSGYKNVLLVGLEGEPDLGLAGKRELTTISALVTDPHFKVESMVAWGRSWVKSLNEISVAGDLIVCPAELTVPAGIGKRESLDLALIRRLKLPVVVLPGFFHDVHPGVLTYLHKFPYWIILVIILAGFFKLESAIDLSSGGWTKQVILLALVIIEVIAVYLWSSKTD
jgi:hypothetical protein